MMTGIVTVFHTAGLTVSEKKTMLLRTPNQAPRTSPLGIETAGQRCKQTVQFLYLGGIVVAGADMNPEIKTMDPTCKGMVPSVCTIWRMLRSL